jgi:hypothetical protein
MAAEPTAPINYLNCRTGWLIAAMAERAGACYMLTRHANAGRSQIA